MKVGLLLLNTQEYIVHLGMHNMQLKFYTPGELRNISIIIEITCGSMWRLRIRRSILGRAYFPSKRREVIKKFITLC
jgi:hypothetical protein